MIHLYTRGLIQLSLNWTRCSERRVKQLENQAPDTHEVTTPSFVSACQTKEQPPASASYPGLTTALGFAFGFGEQGLGSVYWSNVQSSEYSRRRLYVWPVKRQDSEGVWLVELDRFLALGRS